MISLKDRAAIRCWLGRLSTLVSVHELDVFEDARTWLQALRCRFRSSFSEKWATRTTSFLRRSYVELSPLLFRFLLVIVTFANDAVIRASHGRSAAAIVIVLLAASAAKLDLWRAQVVLFSRVQNESTDALFHCCAAILLRLQFFFVIVVIWNAVQLYIDIWFAHLLQVLR